jgi:hypothetical protein
MSPRLLALLLAASSAAFGAGNEFDRLVKAVESHFGVRRTYVPLMGFANFIVNVARPEGARGFKLAIFEDFRGDPADPELDRIMERAAGGAVPMVRTHSRRDGEASYIYLSEAGKVSRVLIATFERHEATIVEVKVDMDRLVRLLDDPARAGRGLSNSGGRRSSDRRDALEP